MINENNEFILELWSRIKSHIGHKDRVDVADILVGVFDEYGQLGDDLLGEELDREMSAAAKSHFGDSDEDLDDEGDYDE